MDARWTALTVLTAARTSMGFQFQSIGSVSPLLIADLRLTYADLTHVVYAYRTFSDNMSISLTVGVPFSKIIY